MDVWRSTDAVYQGYLQYRDKKKLLTRCRWFTAKVLLESSEGQKRLELRDAEDSQLAVISIPLNAEVLSVSTVEAKELKHAFQIVTTRKIHLFGTRSVDQRTRWMGWTSDVANSVPLSNVVYSYEVEMLPNVHSNLLNLHGMYSFKINDTHIALFSNSGLLPTQFMLDQVHIVRIRFTFFKQNSKDFCICAIYTHRCSPIGEGTYVFQTQSGKDLAKIMSRRVTLRYQLTGTPIPDNLLDEKLHKSSSTLMLPRRHSSSTTESNLPANLTQPRAPGEPFLVSTHPVPMATYFTQPRAPGEPLLVSTHPVPMATYLTQPQASGEPLLVSTLPMATMDGPNSDCFLSGSSPDTDEWLAYCPTETCHSPHHEQHDEDTGSSVAMSPGDTWSLDRDKGHEMRGKESNDTSISSKHKPNCDQQQFLYDTGSDTGSEQDTDDRGYIRVLPYQQPHSDSAHQVPDHAHHSQTNDHAPSPNRAAGSLHRFDLRPRVINPAGPTAQCYSIGRGTVGTLDCIAADSVVMATGHMSRNLSSMVTPSDARKASINSISYEHKLIDHQQSSDDTGSDTGSEQDTDDHGYIRVLPYQQPHSDSAHQVPDHAHLHTRPSKDWTIKSGHAHLKEIGSQDCSMSADITPYSTSSDKDDITVECSGDHYECIRTEQTNQYADIHTALVPPTDPMSPVGECIYATVEETLQVPHLEATPHHDVDEVNYTASLVDVAFDVGVDNTPGHNERTKSISLRPPVPLPRSLPHPPAPLASSLSPPPTPLPPPPAPIPGSLPPHRTPLPKSLPPPPVPPPRSLLHHPTPLPRSLHYPTSLPRSLCPHPTPSSLLPTISIEAVHSHLRTMTSSHSLAPMTSHSLGDLTMMQRSEMDSGEVSGDENEYVYTSREALEVPMTSSHTLVPMTSSHSLAPMTSSHSLAPMTSSHSLTPMTSSHSLGDLTMLQRSEMESGEVSDDDNDEYIYANRETLGDMFLKRKGLSLSSQNIYFSLRQHEIRFTKSSNFIS